MDEMTREEMQRLLDEEYKEGTKQDEALRKLARVLGLHYGEVEDKTETPKAPES